MQAFFGILLLCLLHWATVDGHDFEKELEYSQKLSHKVMLEWEFDDDDIIMKLSVYTRAWIGVGFSPGTNMAGADIIIGGVTRGEGYLIDAFAKENGAPDVDESKDVTLISSKQGGYMTSVTFKRKIKSSDPFDRDITNGEMNVIWAYGLGDIKGSPSILNYHLWRRGSTKVRFFPDFEESDFIYSVDLHHKSVTLDWFYNDVSVTFRYSAPSLGWIGVGFSPGGTMEGGDMVMGGIWREPYFFDVYSLENGAPIYDEDQNTELLKMTREGKKITFVARRRLDTIGKYDLPIRENMTVIWAHGPLNIQNERPTIFNYHLWNRGAKEIVLLPVPIDDRVSEPEDSETTPPPLVGTDPGKMGGSVTLDSDRDVKMVWGIQNDKLVISITAPTTGWVGVGFSRTGDMTGADIMIGGISNDTTKYVWDAYATRNGVPLVGESQDVDLIVASENDVSTSCMFSRNLISSESTDISIMSQDLYVIWAFGSEDMVGKPEADDYHGSNRGAMRMNFMAS